jgi:MFS family permease
MLKLPRPIKMISLVAFLYTLGWAIVDPFFFIYLKQLFGNYASIGFLTAILYLLAILWALPIGQLLDRVSEKLIILITLTMYFPMGYFLITLRTFTEFALLKVYNSFTAASIWVSMEGYVREHANKKNAYKAFGLFDTLFTISYVIGPILGALLLMKFGFSMFFVISITSLLAFILALTLKDHKKEKLIKGLEDTIEKDGLFKKGFKDFIRNKKMMKIEIFSFLFTFGGTSMAMIIPLFLNQEKATYLQIGIISSLYYLPAISQSYFSTLKRKGGLIKTSLIVAALLLIAIFFTTKIYALFILFTGLSLATTAIYSVLRGGLTNCMPKKEVGELSGADMSLKYMAGGLGFLVSGVIAQALGLKYVFLMVAVMMIAMLVLTSRKEFKLCNFSGK